MRLTIYQFIAICRFLTAVAGQNKAAWIGGKLYADAKVYEIDELFIACTATTLEMEIKNTKTQNPVIMVDENNKIYRNHIEWVDLQNKVLEQFKAVVNGICS